MINTYHSALVWACGAILGVIAAVALAWLVARSMAVLRRALNRGELVVFALMAGVCTYAAQKHLVTLYNTDPEVRYIFNNRSYVEWDEDAQNPTCTVHIDFDIAALVPTDAVFYIDYRACGVSNAQWQTAYTFTRGNVEGVDYTNCFPPIDFQWAGGTNDEWCVYTTWTPQTVVTNGVWHANWARSTSGHIIPVRTHVKLDAELIAPPVDLDEILLLNEEQE